MAKLYYQGHASFRVTAADGTVIYVDPYVGDGYNLSADLVLVTHEHSDHNVVSLIKQKPGCQVLRPANMLIGGKYQEKKIGAVTVRAVPAYNKNHDRASCEGYLIEVDGKKIYVAGDTSFTDFMRDELPREAVDYALLPVDGVYNMGIDEAVKCAEAIGAKHTIPIHVKPGALFDLERAKTFTHPSALIVQPSEEIEL